MYGFISLNVKCPSCGASLMDREHLVDNKPGIHLMIEYAGSKGHIRLSSIYDSYNFTADVDVPSGQSAKFYCPSCAALLNSGHACASCKADMVSLYLDMGGRVAICSRRGCRNHKIEFEDLATALNKFHEDFSYEDDFVHHQPKVVYHEPEKKPVDERHEIISSGTFLQTYCPHCHHSLLEDDMLKLKVKMGETGFVMLSPFLNVFTSKSTIYLPEDQVIREIRCWHCDSDLVAHGKKCGLCGSPTARISVGARTKLIDFYICTKKGCRWHGLDEDDMFDIKLDDSPEW